MHHATPESVGFEPVTMRRSRKKRASLRHGQLDSPSGESWGERLSGSTCYDAGMTNMHAPEYMRA